MRGFLETHAGKGTSAVLLACLLLVYPPALSWLAASVCLVMGVRYFRDSFRMVDAEDEAGTGDDQAADGAAGGFVAAQA